MVIDLLTAVVLAFVFVRVAQGSRVALGPRRAHVVWLWRSVRLRHAALAVPLLAAIVAAAYAIVRVPGLDVGWWSLLGGAGNPVTGSTERTTGTALEWSIPLVFLALLLPALPLFAEREEQWFRFGAEGRSFWGRRWKDLQFGLVHVVIGIPIGVALVLSIGGAAFTAWYLRGHRRGGRLAALRESTAAHTAYNAIIVAVALFAFGALAFGFE